MSWRMMLKLWRYVVRVGILTGGGDVPGLNPAIKAVVNRCAEAGIEVIGIKRGWGGLLVYDNLDDPTGNEERAAPLTPLHVRTIDRYGGTTLQTSRADPQRVSEKDQTPEFLSKGRFPFTRPQNTADCTPHVLKVLEHLGIDTLVPIGGDDTLSYAVRMYRRRDA
jgi:6-phosphofructokinase 1